MNDKEKILDSADEYQSKVFDMIEELCLTSVHDLDQTLLGDFSMDSLRLVMLLVTLEDTFGIELDESDMNPFVLVTVRDVINLVRKYVSPQKKGADHV